MKRGETLRAPSTDITERYFPLLIFLLVKCRWKIGVKAAIRWNITFIIDNHRVTPQGLASTVLTIPKPFATGEDLFPRNRAWDGPDQWCEGDLSTANCGL